MSPQGTFKQDMVIASSKGKSIWGGEGGSYQRCLFIVICLEILAIRTYTVLSRLPFIEVCHW